mmetsp:Transcript_28060/g.77232  ORF Transcript_28060/g.77232 Transcript_28060/m.77232 type:complete len:277 (-) Transcript_28060:829-1659(-)
MQGCRLLPISVARLKLRMARVAREGDDVADVLHACAEHDQALKAHAKACVWHRAVLPQLTVPPVVFLAQAHCLHALIQHVQALLTLSSTDELANARAEDIHGSDGFAVVVEPHVEGFAILGVVVNDGRLLVQFLSEVALVFRLQLLAPRHLVLKLDVTSLDRLLQPLHGFRVADPLERLAGNQLKALQNLLVYAEVEELKVWATLLEDCRHAVPDVLLGAIHVVVKVCEGHLGFNHPELRQVPGGAGVLGAERWPEGVHIPQGATEVLHRELATDR